jgi:ZIP family zinc transporter
VRGVPVVTTILAAALLAAAGFAVASLLALLGKGLGAGGGPYAAAFAAGILLALAFADLLPEGLDLARGPAVMGFVAGFSLLFLTEVFTRAHTHHVPEGGVNKHALGPFVLGLAVHNLADGFVLGVGAKASAIASWLVGLGILVHQVPVGISLAAVFVAARATGARVVWTAVLLGLAIPLAASATLALPAPGEGALGALTGVAGGVLAYVGSAHLLPEAQAENSSRKVGLLFVVTLVLTTVGLLYGPGE